MKKMGNKLFTSLELTPAQAQKTVGGFYTTKDQDTTSSTSANFDVTFKTTNKDGSEKGTDAVFTGSDTTDQPNTGIMDPGFSIGHP